MTRLVFALFIVFVMSATYYGGKTVLSEAGIGPDSPWYFFDGLMEKADILGVKDKEKKVEKLIEFLKEKYAEAGASLQKGDNVSAKIALKAGDKYAGNALDFINSLKLEGRQTEKLAEGLGSAVLEKQKIFAMAYKDAPPAAKAYIEEIIKKEGSGSETIIKHLSAATGEKFTIQMEQTEALASDKLAEAKEQEEKKELEGLTKQEQLYNVWIEHFYSTSDGEMIAINAHVSRRDPMCSEFRGKLKLFINNNFYKELEMTVGGYDDIRGAFDKILLEKGSYRIKGELIDMQGRVISRREIKLVI